jgi:hypothetical protein
MRLRTYVATIAAALALSFSVLAQQPPPGGPPAAPAAPPLGPPAPFYPHVVSTGLRGGYQVVATDMNKDGKVDLIGVGSQNPELVWYENPYWTPHVITREAARMVNVDAADLDGDGIPELALAYEFSTNSNNNPGKIAILTATNKDPKQMWTFKQIDQLPMTSHRVRFATINGQKLLASAPIITAESADGFTNSNHTVTPLHIYRPPAWKREVVTEESRGVVHGLVINDWNGDGRADLLTTGYMGLFMHSLDRNGSWTRSEIIKGDPGEWPRGGISDVAIGRFGGKRFIVTNEPFHGNQVVVYVPTADGAWPRTIVDTTINNAHSLVLVDSDGDGTSEIVSGGTRGAPGTARGTKPGAFFYKAADASGQKWDRMVLDDSIAANSCVAADINGDRKMDLACIDAGNPWSLKWYENSRK